jgi:hypothetical protein
MPDGLNVHPPNRQRLPDCDIILGKERSCVMATSDSRGEIEKLIRQLGVELGLSGSDLENWVQDVMGIYQLRVKKPKATPGE